MSFLDMYWAAVSLTLLIWESAASHKIKTRASEKNKTMEKFPRYFVNIKFDFSAFIQGSPFSIYEK